MVLSGKIQVSTLLIAVLLNPNKLQLDPIIIRLNHKFQTNFRLEVGNPVDVDLPVPPGRGGSIHPNQWSAGCYCQSPWWQITMALGAGTCKLASPCCDVGGETQPLTDELPTPSSCHPPIPPHCISALATDSMPMVRVCAEQCCLTLWGPHSDLI